MANDCVAFANFEVGLRLAEAWQRLALLVDEDHECVTNLSGFKLVGVEPKKDTESVFISFPKGEMRSVFAFADDVASACVVEL
jgi:hypothetical protein